MVRNGAFRPFFRPQGAKWKNHCWYLIQTERCTGRAECTQVTLFPYKCWVFEEKTRFGGPQAVTRFEKWTKLAKGHWEKLRCRAVYARILKTPMGKTKQIKVAFSPSILFLSDPGMPGVRSMGPSLCHLRDVFET